MKIALGQIETINGQIESNIENHIEYCREAGHQNCDLIVFPELSLTGYQPETAAAHAFSIHDFRLWPLQEVANQYQLYIAVGAPVRIREYLGIGMIWITPDTFPITYTKQQLHPSEEVYFSPLSTMQTFQIGTHRIAPAICYESTLKESVQRAYSLDADIYLVSTAKKQEKLPETQEQLESFSKEFGLTTLMVNFVGESGAFRSAGGSSVWSREGALLGRLEDPETGLLIYDLDKQSTAVVSQMAY